MSDIIIKANSLCKQYMKQMAVKDASFEIKKGAICGLIGPNGAGKTTIMKMLGGLIIPTEGSIEILGQTTEQGLAEARKQMSFMIETPYAKENLNARENLEKQRLQKGLTDKSVIERSLKLVGLENTGRKAVKQFSLGMRQRLGIANALMSNPSILVLDEPINGLDPEGIKEIREMLLKLNREQGITIVISSHILSELSLLCTDYIFINHGMIKQAVSSEQLSEICREYYLIHTDNDELAKSVLTDKLGLTGFSECDDGIKLYDGLDDLKRVSAALYENGVVPLILSINKANLEEYYMNMAEGDENA